MQYYESPLLILKGQSELILIFFLGSNYFFFRYLDYSTLGVIIGHEIAHAFDTGAKKEINNNLVFNNVTINDFNTTLWSKHLNEEYEKKTKCFVQQFNNYSVDEINEKVKKKIYLIRY